MDITKAVRYDPKTGAFTWAKKRGFIQKGAKAGGLINGRYYITFQGKPIPAHRVAWSIMTGQALSDKIRFKNGNPLDLRFCNLYRLGAREGVTVKDNRTGETLVFDDWLQVIEHACNRYQRDKTP